MLGRCFNLDDSNDGDDDDDSAEGEYSCHGYLLLPVDLGCLQAVELPEEENHHYRVLAVDTRQTGREWVYTHYITHNIQSCSDVETVIGSFCISLVVTLP